MLKDLAYKFYYKKEIEKYFSGKVKNQIIFLMIFGVIGGILMFFNLPKDVLNILFGIFSIISILAFRIICKLLIEYIKTREFFMTFFINQIIKTKFGRYFAYKFINYKDVYKNKIFKKFCLLKLFNCFVCMLITSGMSFNPVTNISNAFNSVLNILTESIYFFWYKFFI